MAHIAPDQDEDSFFHVFTKDHNSDSSEEQIQSGQDLAQQATSSPPVPQTDSPQASQWPRLQCCLYISTGPLRTDPSSGQSPSTFYGPTSSGGIVDNVFIAVDPPLWHYHRHGTNYDIWEMLFFQVNHTTELK